MRRAKSILPIIIVLLTCGRLLADTTGDPIWKTIRDGDIVIECEAETEEIARQTIPLIRQAMNSDWPEQMRHNAEVLRKQKKDLLRFIAGEVGLAKPCDLMDRAFDVFAGCPLALHEYWAKDLHFRLWRKEKLKQFLAAGGTVPFVADIPLSDNVTVGVAQDDMGSRKPTDPIPLVLSSTSEKTPMEQMAECVDDYFKPIDPNELMWMVCHETAEVGLVYSTGIDSAFRRWFFDGVAEYVALRCAEKLGDEKSRQRILDDRAISQFADLKGQVELRYWRAAEWAEHGPSARYDGRLCSAHYSFAFHEIRGLADRHGPEIIPAICREIAKSKDKSPNDHTIIKAIAKTAGEDFNVRLLDYGTKSDDKFKGFAIRNVRFYTIKYDSGRPPKTNEVTSSIPLSRDREAGFVLVFDCTSDRTPVEITTELRISRSTTIVDRFTLEKSPDVASFIYRFSTQQYKPGRHTFDVLVNGKLFTKVDFELVEEKDQPAVKSPD